MSLGQLQWEEDNHRHHFRDPSHPRPPYAQPLVPLSEYRDASASDEITAYLQSEKGLSWLALQMAEFDHSASTVMTDFHASIKEKFEQEVLPRLPKSLPLFPWSEGGPLHPDILGKSLPPLLWALPWAKGGPLHLPSLPPHLLKEVLGKYWDRRMQLSVEQNLKWSIKRLALLVPSCSLGFEGTKQCILHAIRKAMGPVGPAVRFCLDSALPSGFFGPAVALVIFTHQALRRAKKVAEKKAVVMNERTQHHQGKDCEAFTDG